MAPRHKHQALILALILAIISFAFRLFKLNQGLWYDEILTLEKFVRLPAREIIISLPLPNNHILYSLLAKLCLSIFGEKEWSLRLPSVFLGGLTPALAYLVLRKRFGEFSAFFTGLFLTLNFWMVWFSQDARGYSGMILFVLLSQVFLLEWMEQRKLWLLILYLICSALACWFHLYSGVVLLAQVAYGFAKWLWQRQAQSAGIFVLPLLGLFLASLLYLPGAMDLLKYVSAGEGRDLGGRWLDLHFFQELVKLCAGAYLFWVGLLLVLVAVPGFFQMQKSQSGILELYLLSGFFLILFTLIWRVFIYARFLAFLIPFFALAMAQGIEWRARMISRFSPKLEKTAVGVLLIAVSLVLLLGLNRYYHLGKQGLKDAAIYIKTNYPQVPVISLGLARNEFRYYYPMAQPVFGQVQIPAQEFSGKLIVASHPWSWAPWNQRILEELCLKEKVWESAGYEENVVYLYNCLKLRSDFGTE